MKLYQKIAIIQPAVPRYRKDYFDELRKVADIKIYTTHKDFLNVKSVADLDYVSYQKNFVGFYGLYWHKNLPISQIIKNFDIVVINGNLRIINYMILLIASKYFKKQIIWWGHLNPAGSYGLFAKIRMQIMRIATKRLFYTEYEYLRYKHKANTYYLNNGLKNVRPMKPRSMGVFANLNSLKIIFIGRLTKKTNIEFALRCLKHSEIEFTFDIIGDGPSYKKLKDTYSSPRFQFHGEINNDRKIKEIVSDAQLFLYPGAVGLSLIHGFNLGLVAIVHNNEKNHMPEYSAFKAGYNGINFVEDDPKSLEKSLLKYMALEQNEKHQMHMNALNTTKQSYNTDDMIQKFVNCITA